MQGAREMNWKQGAILNSKKVEKFLIMFTHSLIRFLLKDYTMDHKPILLPEICNIQTLSLLKIICPYLYGSSLSLLVEFSIPGLCGSLS